MEEPTDMVQLLEALQEENADRIDALACGLFITNDGGCNWENILEFEKYANCKIYALEKDSFGWLIGGIRYGGKTYAYG